MINPSLRYARMILAAMATGVLAGCVSIKTVDDDQVPEAWRALRPTKQTPVGKFDLAVSGNGQSVHSSGTLSRERLGAVFFPGAGLRAGRCELHFDGAHELIVTALTAGSTVATVTLAVTLDPETGMLFAASIPSKDGSKFGVVLAAAHTALLYVGRDQALYVKVRQSGVGTIAVIPAGGVATWWGRWEATLN